MKREAKRRKITEKSILEFLYPLRNRIIQFLKNVDLHFFPLHSTRILSQYSTDPFCQGDRSQLLTDSKYCLLQTFQLTHVKKAL